PPGFDQHAFCGCGHRVVHCPNVENFAVSPNRVVGDFLARVNLTSRPRGRVGRFDGACWQGIVVVGLGEGEGLPGRGGRPFHRPVSCSRDPRVVDMEPQFALLANELRCEDVVNEGHGEGRHVSEYREGGWRRWVWAWIGAWIWG